MQRHAQSPQRRAFDLGQGAVRMDDRAGVDDDGQLLDHDAAARAIDPHPRDAGDPGRHVALLAEGGGDAEPDIFRQCAAPAGLLRRRGRAPRLAAARRRPRSALIRRFARRRRAGCSRNATGSTPAVWAASSMKLSTAQLIQPGPTERNQPGRKVRLARSLHSARTRWAPTVYQ